MDEVTFKIVSERFRQKYDEVDKELQNVPTACAKGCDFCCHKSIEILNWEEPLILEYIEKNLSELQKNNIKRQLNLWFDYFDLRMPKKRVLNVYDVFVDFNRAVAKDRIPCMFLEDHQCLIYPVRPISCRTHSVNTSVQKCKEDPLRESSTEAKCVRQKVYAGIAHQLPSYLTLLNFSIARIFGLEGRVRMADEKLFEEIK